ncbi:kinesin light chain-like [Gigantopelta aegis]|uniref:kinesin light chain-like n=1 Tax=Gigantopelta aegis TaxID=1735272 RepID=UPI001B887657|nr:kinesin light chain-like [Gigantopelta aegis]
MIQFEARTRRYNMHGILRDCLEVYYKIDNIPEIRKRYCRTFGQVIRELSSRMETSEYVEAYADINQEHPNLRKMLTDVMHSEQESFPFYVEMATSSASLIIAFFGNESIQFFTKCFELAELYGKQRDRALVMTHYGRALTNVKSDFVEGRRMLTMAMDIMEQSPPSESLAAILLSLGWTVYLQGDIPEAAKHFSRGLEVTQETGCENSLIKCKFLNCLGLANNAEGNQEAAEKYMFGALRSYIKKIGNEHPCVGSVYNNIGLLMKSKHDHDKAKEYFELGLQIKQKMKAPLTATIVSQNNVADSYITLERYFEAKILLESALASLEYTPGLYSFERGLIFDTFGKMYLKQENYQDAIATLQKAVDIRRTYNEGSVNHIESLIHLGKAYKGAGAEDEALKSFEEAVFYESKVYKWKIDALRMDSYYLEMIDILTNLGDVIRVKAVYKKATAHLTAMIKMNQTKPRPHLVEQYEKQLAELQESQHTNSLLCKLESCNT